MTRTRSGARALVRCRVHPAVVAGAHLLGDEHQPADRSAGRQRTGALFADRAPTLKNYQTCSAAPGRCPDQIRRSAVNIVVECAAATIVTVLLATLAAYAFARMTVPRPQRAVLRRAGHDGLPGVHDADPAVPDHGRLRPGEHLHRHRAGLRLGLPAAGDVDHAQLPREPALRIEEAGQVDGAEPDAGALASSCCRWPCRASSPRRSSRSSSRGRSSSSRWCCRPTCRPSRSPWSSGAAGQHVVPTTLLSAAGVIAIAVPAVIGLTLNRYIVSGLLAGSVK